MSIFKKLRFYLRLFIALIKKQYLILLISGLIGGAFFFVYPKIQKYIPETKTTLKIGLIGQYTSNDLPEVVLKDISFGLVSLNEKGEPIPNIAESWTATDEGKIYTFKITAKNLVWHDGQEFNIKDINYNFKDVASVIDKDKISFTLKDPFSPFPNIVSKPLFRKGLIGLGDYKIKKIVKKGTRIESVSLVTSSKKNIPNKIFHFYNNEEDLKTGFNLGEVNFIPEIFDVEGISLGPLVKINNKLMSNAYTAVFLNANQPPFSDKTFRQSLAYAISKPTGEVRALGPLNPSSWAYNPDVKPYNFDIVRAKSLLENDKTVLKTLKIKISTLPQYEDVTNEIVANWKQLGINAEVNITSYVPENFDVLIAAREIPPDPDQYYLWHSTQAGNLSKYKSPRLDKLLEDGRKILDKEERKSIYFDFQRFLVEESPAIFLSHPIYYEVTRN